MRKMIPLVGLLMALAIPTVASADSGDGGGLCNEGWQGLNLTTRQFLSDFESPQKGTPRNQGVWVDTGRTGGGGSFATTLSATSSVNTGGSNWKTYCVAHMHWDKSTAFGPGEDHFKVSFVVYSTSAYPGVFSPAAYGSYEGNSYWTADSNGASANFSIAMPWGGTSNYRYPKP